MYKILNFKASIFLISLIVAHSSIYAQSSQLSESFLNSLDPELREQLSEENSGQDENEELEKLFKSKSSVDTNKEILKQIKDRLYKLESNLNEEEQFNSIKRFGDDFFGSYQSTFMPINLPNLDSSYIVDVGDTFEILLTGKINDKFESVVSRDGNIFLPNIGDIFVAGKNLGKIQSDIQQYVDTVNLGVKSFVSIKSLRDIQVLILGFVENPGIYTVSGNSHFLHALNVAGGISENGSFRNISHKRNGTTISLIDLYDLLAFGNYDSSLVMRSGDTIYVNPVEKSVSITGGVNMPAIFEIKDKESLNELIEFAGGFSVYSDLYSEIKINRIHENGFEILNLNKNDIKSFVPQARDSIYVPYFKNEFLKTREVTISGWVKKPGTYVIDEGETFLSLLLKAGGLKQGAYPFGTALYREDSALIESKFSKRSYDDAVTSVISRLGTAGAGYIDAGVLKLLLSEISRSKSSGRVVGTFDPDLLSANPSLDMLLEDGDKLTVPPFRNSVYVFGEFSNSGTISYSPELGVRDYISLAGGTKDISNNEIILIDPDGKTHTFINRKSLIAALDRNQIAVYPGSIIYASKDIGQLQSIEYAETLTSLLSNVALTLASLSTIN